MCISTQGQAISGDLTGTVTDVSGAVVPNATVTATNSATDVKSSAHANFAGLYRIPNLYLAITPSLQTRPDSRISS
jgi:Carboxypeptidase regulatory-like domain